MSLEIFDTKPVTEEQPDVNEGVHPNRYFPSRGRMIDGRS
jgi:hypothetical protein